MSIFSLVNHTDYMTIEGDVYVVDYSRITTNLNSFNRTFIGNSVPPLSPLEPTLSTPSDYDVDVDPSASGNLHDTIILENGQPKVPLPHRTSISPTCISVEHIYPPPPRFNVNTQAFKSQRTPHPYSNLSSDVPEFLGSTRNSTDTTTPTRKNLRQNIFRNIKHWFEKLLSFVFIRRL